VPPYAEAMPEDESRFARVEDVHELALTMPHVTGDYGTGDNPIYQVGGKSASPFFTTAHFNGHLSVLLRADRVGELTRGEVAEIVQDAW
jgi:hypothetical protein